LSSSVVALRLQEFTTAALGRLAIASKIPLPFLQKLKTLRLRASARLKRRSFGLKLPQKRLMGLAIFRRQMVDEEDAVEVVVLVLGGA